MHSPSSTENRRGPGRPNKDSSLALDLGAYLRARLLELHPVDDGKTWPSSRYRQDPVAFFTEVLGVHAWDKQIRIAEALTKHTHVAVKGGRKVGKSELAAMLALWVFCSFPGVAVWIISGKKEQSEDIIWRAIRKLCRNAKIPIGDPADRGETGLKAPNDDRMIKVIAASEAGSRGHSGVQFYLIDEACDVPDGVYDVIDGNVAGGGCFVLAISNPIRDIGRFYDAFHSHSGHWDTHTIRSLDTPNVLAGEILIPGLATLEWCEAMAAKHGEKSIWYKHHVLGEFVEGEAGRIVTMAVLEAATKDYDRAPGEGPLFVGIDPAGPGIGGDVGVFSFIRGSKLLGIFGHEGITPESYVAHLHGYADRYAPNPREAIVICVDGEGQEGARVSGALRAMADSRPARYWVRVVRSGKPARRLPESFELIHDELWHFAAVWLESGGKIPDHGLLLNDLHAPSWGYSRKHKQIASNKDALRKILGRSPDYGDALNLAVWGQSAKQYKTERDLDVRTEVTVATLRHEGRVGDEIRR